jgi:hypothetical protein
MNPKVHYRVHNSPPFVRFFKTHVNIILLSMPRSPSCLHPSSFLIKTKCASLFYPVYAISPAHIILLDSISLISLIIFGKIYKSWSFFLCNFLHPSLTASVLGKISSSAAKYYKNLVSSYVLLSQTSNKHSNETKTGSVRIHVTLRCVRKTTVAVEKQ